MELFNVKHGEEEIAATLNDSGELEIELTDWFACRSIGFKLTKAETEQFIKDLVKK